MYLFIDCDLPWQGAAQCLGKLSEGPIIKDSETKKRQSVLRLMRAVTASPEFVLALFAVLVNLPWELWQIPFFRGMGSRPHAEGVRLCTEAALGDALITLTAFGLVACVARTRQWVLHAGRGLTLLFVAFGLAVTALIELLALRAGRWSYSENMPIVPLLGIGVVPVVQWLILPLIVLWLTRRQLLGLKRDR